MCLILLAKNMTLISTFTILPKKVKTQYVEI